MRAPLALTLTVMMIACGGGNDASTAQDTSSGDAETTSHVDDDAATSGEDAPPEEEDAATAEDDAGPVVTREDAAVVTEDTHVPVDPDALEVMGTWDTNFGMVSEITAETWDGSAVVGHDNADNWAIVQMPEDAEWNPGTYSKFVWTEPIDGRWFLCIVDYALETAEDAEDTQATADASSPLEGGCGDFAWTELRAPIEVKGDWHTNWDENLTVTTYDWGTQEALVYHDNDANWAVTRMSATASWNPNTYSKLVWTEPADDGSFWMCTAAYGLETEAAAKSDATEVDSTDPATGGCGGFSWSHYMPILELTGSWVSESGEHKIDSTVWGLDVVYDYDNDDNWAVVQQPASDDTNPSKFMKSVWTEPTEDGFYTCSVASGFDTPDEALDAEDTSDDSDPDTGGCGGAPWTMLTPAE